VQHGRAGRPAGSAEPNGRRNDAARGYCGLQDRDGEPSAVWPLSVDAGHRFSPRDFVPTMKKLAGLVNSMGAGRRDDRVNVAEAGFFPFVL
jgi:hypothetical protein